MEKKGFTLVELLIVIGILAILTAAVVVVLNPAELLRQARDSQRMSDLDSIRSAVNLYLATATTPTLGTTAYCMVGTSHGAGTCTTNATTTVAGDGWVDVNLTATSGGSPLSVLPTDPVDDATYYYAYDGDDTNKTFELNARLESTKYRDNMTTDGGTDNNCSTYIEATCYYEIGTEPGLDLLD